MTIDEYTDLRNDPNRPMGLFGPIGGQQIYLINVPRPAAMGPASARHVWHGHDPVSRRLAAHARAAELDREIARLRARRDNDAAIRERLDRHAKDAEHDRVVARLRRLR